MPEIGRDRLVEHLDTFLAAGAGHDYCPNGLQVQGKQTIERLVTGVSSCQELFRQAVARKADAVLVHHGLLWEKEPRPLVGLLYQRVKILLDAGLNLIAYHLPLDRHPEVGNNAVAARRFGIADLHEFGAYDDLPIGFGGSLETPLSPADFATRCLEVFGQAPLAFQEGAERIERVAFVSGAAESLFHEAIAQGYDAFVTGEVSEWVMNVARETRTHFYAAGHYATERLGVQALGEHLEQEFGLSVDFVDIPNPV